MQLAIESLVLLFLPWPHCSCPSLPHWRRAGVLLLVLLPLLGYVQLLLLLLPLLGSVLLLQLWGLLVHSLALSLLERCHLHLLLLMVGLLM